MGLPPDWLRGDRPLVWAHRGASAAAPENTLAAFALAAELGADGVELDAQRCATGEVVVFHDETLGRTAGRPGLLAQTSWSELARCDVGARFSSRFAGERVPLLAEVLARTPPTLLVNVELKCETADDRGLTAAVVEVVLASGAAARVLFSSFNPGCLLRARALARQIPRAHLFERTAKFPLHGAWLGPVLGAAALHPPASDANDANVHGWRKLGYAVAPWTVDDEEQARQLLAAGCTGLITNVPDRMRRLVDS